MKSDWHWEQINPKAHNAPFFPTPPHFLWEITSLLPWLCGSTRLYDWLPKPSTWPGPGHWEFTWLLTQNGKASSPWGRIHCQWGGISDETKGKLFPRGRWANRAPNGGLPHSLGKTVSNRQAVGSSFPGLTAWIQTPGAFHQQWQWLSCLCLLTKFKLDFGHDQPKYPNTAYWCQVAQIIRWNERKKKKVWFLQACESAEWIINILFPVPVPW